MDAVLAQLIGSAPWAILLFFMLRQVYEDARTDRVAASVQIQAMMQKLDSLDKSLMLLQISIENQNTLRRRTEKHREE